MFSLPTEMIREISSFLSEEDLNAFSQTSTRLHSDLHPEIKVRKNKYTTRPPSLVSINDGTQVWLNSHRQIHNVDGPAIVYKNGDKVWYRCGLPDGQGGPVCTKENGTVIMLKTKDRKNGVIVGEYTTMYPDGSTNCFVMHSRPVDFKGLLGV